MLENKFIIITHSSLFCKEQKPAHFCSVLMLIRKAGKNQFKHKLTHECVSESEEILGKKKKKEEILEERNLFPSGFGAMLHLSQ